MTTASAKSKGRRLQQFVRDTLRRIGYKYGLEDDDVKSTGMGQSGVDVLLSPAAKKLFGNLSLECKNVESLNVTTTYFGHAAKYPNGFNLLVHKRNNTAPLVTLLWNDFIAIFERTLKEPNGKQG